MSSRDSSDLVPADVADFLASRGEALVGVRERFVAAVARWALDVGDVLHGGWNSLVVGARSGDASVVLKLPALAESAGVEAAALGWWGPECAPRVLAHDGDLGAVLLEQLVPGSEFPWVRADHTLGLTPLLRALRRPRDHVSPQIPTLADQGQQELAGLAENLAHKRSLVDVGVVHEAQELLRYLFAEQQGEQVVLHGDLVPANVILGRGAWRVIDPRPCSGEPAYDAAYWSVFSGYGREARKNVKVLANELDLKENRVLSWAWALAVSRLLQIVDSPHPGHAPLVRHLNDFINEARREALRS